MGLLDDIGGLLGTGATIYGLSQLGRTPTPSVKDTTAEALEAYRLNYPAYAEMLRQEAGRELERQQELYPEQLKLAQQQLAAAKAFVPQYGQLASDEAYREAMSEAGKQVDVLRAEIDRLGQLCSAHVSELAEFQQLESTQQARVLKRQHVVASE